MLNKLVLEVVPPEGQELNVNKSSLFHGALMELILPDYANKMHESTYRPYSQSLIKTKENKYIWTVNTLDEEAYKNIVLPLLLTSEVEIKHNNMKVQIVGRELKQTTYDQLFLDNYYGKTNSRYVTMNIETPTSLKVEGNYLIYPDAYYLISGLVKRYDAISCKSKVLDDNLLNTLKGGVKISSYNLRSSGFSMEGVKIPSFEGRLTLKVDGGELLVNLINMMLDFGEYSGLGIKTALGMGKMIHVRKE